ncbi:acyl-CoA dehydrogenase [Candidatus Uabimicrobium amorphum]|uniref:Acyl-coenzyme A dehydrogenase n=1 Tax=Uabimicrobium amorphum TaxID=2596890 RepID=A0A5S9IQ09_UABAM|nr:acyl-CoA dehydrogenase [Candidatus Uabimicrobium amorphum]BBM85968.1 acyl-CoA dehydrogenase [Candidatus Uabimicrobium amorphum]
MFGWMIRFIKRNNLLPKISDTERAALEAGSVWIDGDLFSGRVNFKKILQEPYPQLSKEEKEFIDGPVSEVCKMVNEYEIRKQKKLPQEVWDYLREHRFFGLVIPKEYGGHHFSALACSTIFGKLGVRSMNLNVTVMIPNSVGPSELLAKYGTKEQKEYYLPRLAKGEDIPCFALTEEKAGSDAGSLRSEGVVFKGEDDKIYVRINWSKRYITLAPIATLIGLAFYLRDPENILGKGEDIGITCILVDAKTEGVEIGRYHDPLNNGFPNGPTRGKDVVVPLENVIGGSEYVGKGWGMLMEALSAGRGISLPGFATAGVHVATRGVAAYSMIREQFSIPIGKMEGIREPLAKMAGFCYLMEATRVFTCGAIDNGHNPSVVSAIVKYSLTELGREAIGEGMDIMAGKAICLGPNNPIAQGYLAAPIAITVEGANILTRTLIIFGQGTIRCHPYLYRQVQALQQEKGGKFVALLAAHSFFMAKNTVMHLLVGTTRGYFLRAPKWNKTRRYYQKLKWASLKFAALTDVAAISMGSQLKKKGNLAGRFSDILSWMYIGTCVLRRYHEEGDNKSDLVVVEWCMEYALWQIQQAFAGIYDNIKVPIIGGLYGKFQLFCLRINPLGKAPRDLLSNQVAQIPQNPGEQRDNLTFAYKPDYVENEPLADLEKTLLLVKEAAPTLRKINQAVKKGELQKQPLIQNIETAVSEGVISKEESTLLRNLENARDNIIRVDDFSWEELTF